MRVSNVDDREERKQVWKYQITYWLGTRNTGEWVPESVLTTLKRKYECFTHSVDSTKAKPIIVKTVFEEIIHMHHGYRPKIDGEKNTRKSFFYQGARRWRN